MDITYNGKKVKNRIAQALLVVVGIIILIISMLFVGVVLALVGGLIAIIMFIVAIVLIVGTLAYPFVWIHNKWKNWRNKK